MAGPFWIHPQGMMVYMYIFFLDRGVGFAGVIRFDDGYTQEIDFILIAGVHSHLGKYITITVKQIINIILVLFRPCFTSVIAAVYLSPNDRCIWFNLDLLLLDIEATSAGCISFFSNHFFNCLGGILFRKSVLFQKGIQVLYFSALENLDTVILVKSFLVRPVAFSAPFHVFFGRLYTDCHARHTPFVHRIRQNLSYQHLPRRETTFGS